MKKSKVKVISISIPETLFDEMEDICTYSFISRSHYITELIRADMERLNEEPARVEEVIR